MGTQLTVTQQGLGSVSADQLNTYTQSCDTFSDLRNFVGITGIQVFARGAGAVNDGSQGFFYWNAGATNPVDDNADTIVPSGAAQGCWTRVTSDVPISGFMTPFVQLTNQSAAQAYLGIGSVQPVLNALNYGVLGNGLADDSAAANAFLSTCVNLGCIAYFPPNLTYNLGSSSLTVPDDLRVIAGENATFVRTAYPITGATGFASYLSCMVILGNRSRWEGGVLNCTAVLTTSSTSNTVATGAKTFTVQSGLNLPAGASLRIWSAANPANFMGGTITSYSGVTLVFNSTSSGGSGTLADWQIGVASKYQAGMVLHDLTNTYVEDCLVQGFFFVGFLFDAWNPPTGGSNQTNACTLRSCYAKSVQSVAFHLFGNIADCVIDGCFADGARITQYGFLCEPSNASGSANSVDRCKIISCQSTSILVNGFELADFTSNCLVENSISSFSGAFGFLITTANAGEPTYNTIAGCQAVSAGGSGFVCAGVTYTNIVGCDAISCVTSGFVFQTSVNLTQYCSANGCSAIFCGTGFQVLANSVRVSLNNIKAVSNTVYGVQIIAGAVTTVASGRSFGNGTANLVDAGTGTVSTNLVTA